MLLLRLKLSTSLEQALACISRIQRHSFGRATRPELCNAAPEAREAAKDMRAQNTIACVPCVQ